MRKSKGRSSAEKGEMYGERAFKTWSFCARRVFDLCCKEAARLIRSDPTEQRWWSRVSQTVMRKLIWRK